MSTNQPDYCSAIQNTAGLYAGPITRVWAADEDMRYTLHTKYQADTTCEKAYDPDEYVDLDSIQIWSTTS